MVNKTKDKSSDTFFGQLLTIRAVILVVVSIVSLGWLLIAVVVGFSKPITQHSPIYINERHGFQIELPMLYQVEVSSENEKVYITRLKTPDVKNQGPLMSIWFETTSVDDFIEEFNQSDVVNGHALSRIIDKETVIIDNREASHLTAHLSIGFEREYLLIPHDDGLLIVQYYEFNEDHKKIVGSLAFIE